MIHRKCSEWNRFNSIIDDDQYNDDRSNASSSQHSSHYRIDPIPRQANATIHNTKYSSNESIFRFYFRLNRAFAFRLAVLIETGIQSKYINNYFKH